jgi:hypothetical protein
VSKTPKESLLFFGVSSGSIFSRSEKLGILFYKSKLLSDFSKKAGKIDTLSKSFCIFANRLTTNVDMQRTETINNSLNMRGLQEITLPPFVEIM